MKRSGSWVTILRRVAILGASFVAVRFVVAFLAGVAFEVWRTFG